jgi:phage-related protein
MEKFNQIINSVTEWIKSAKANIASVIESIDKVVTSIKDLFGIKEEETKEEEETEEEETEEK